MSRLRRLLRRSRTARALAGPALSVRRGVIARRARADALAWDRLRRLLADDPVVRVDAFGGQFQLDARSHLLQRLWRDGDYEPETRALCERLVDPDRDVLDIGANAGFFSVLLSARLRGGRLLAVEPSAAMVRRLRANLARNGAERVLVEHAALSDAEGTVELRALAGKEEYGTIGVPAHPGIRADAADRDAEMAVETVRALPLDRLVEAHGLRPALLKVDVEGAEMRVFQGATETLREHRPAVVTELNDRLLRANGTTARAVVGLFEAHGYRVLDPSDPAHPPVTDTFLATSEDVLCLPAERAAG